MATRGHNLKMFDVFFVPILLTIVMCLATWNRYDNDEIVYQWMEVGFIVAILFRLLITAELCLASKMGLDFLGERAHFCVRELVLRALYSVLYPSLWAWNTLGLIWWLIKSERGQLPKGGLKWCCFIFLVIGYDQLFRFVTSCVEKHTAQSQRQPPILQAEQSRRISENEVRHQTS